MDALLVGYSFIESLEDIIFEIWSQGYIPLHLFLSQATRYTLLVLGGTTHMSQVLVTVQVPNSNHG